MKDNSGERKICWVITGAGHFLRECAKLIASFGEVDVYLTRAAMEVAPRYGVMATIERASGGISREEGYSSAPLIRFSSGKYSLLVIAPATSNTMAKCALGIADSLASNFFAQAGKSGVPIVVLPTDVASRMTSETPSGRMISVTPRPIDLEHTEAVSKFPGVSVVLSVADLAGAAAPYLAPGK
ncbi:MAG: flavoprotein [Synergistaceae bacterium]|jgi:flavoprotein|nr:flavoprotein [Synergistaceae bacterium]